MSVFFRRLIVLLLFIALVGTFYYFQFVQADPEPETYAFRDDFKGIDRDFWYIGEWQTMFTAYDKVSIKNDILTAEIKETDRGPFLLSKPIPVEEGDVITIRRRVRLHYDNDNFTGGMAIVQTSDDELKPIVLENNWGRSIGDGVALVEYVHSYDEESERPGRDIFRVMGPAWKSENAYAVIEPTYDDWIEEELVFDTRTNQILYKVGGKEYRVNGMPITRPSIRVFMHAYGWHTGHSMKLDWFEIEVKNMRLRR